MHVFVAVFILGGALVGLIASLVRLKVYELWIPNATKIYRSRGRKRADSSDSGGSSNSSPIRQTSSSKWGLQHLNTSLSHLGLRGNSRFSTIDYKHVNDDGDDDDDDGGGGNIEMNINNLTPSSSLIRNHNDVEDMRFEGCNQDDGASLKRYRPIIIGSRDRMKTPKPSKDNINFLLSIQHQSSSHGLVSNNAHDVEVDRDKNNNDGSSEFRNSSDDLLEEANKLLMMG